MEMRHRYLLRSKDREKPTVRIVPELRQKIKFERLNFMDEDYGISKKFDVIFFRNVMIYFERLTQQKVVQKLCRHLRKGGYFFAGHSESLVGLDIPVKTVSASVFQKVI